MKRVITILLLCSTLWACKKDTAPEIVTSDGIMVTKSIVSPGDLPFNLLFGKSTRFKDPQTIVVSKASNSDVLTYAISAKDGTRMMVFYKPGGTAKKYIQSEVQDADGTKHVTWLSADSTKKVTFKTLGLYYSTFVVNVASTEQHPVMMSVKAFSDCYHAAKARCMEEMVCELAWDIDTALCAATVAAGCLYML